MSNRLSRSDVRLLAVALGALGYIIAVLMCQFAIYSKPSDLSLETVKDGQCDLQTYIPLPVGKAKVSGRRFHSDANPWLLQTHRSLTVTSEILTSENCFRALAVDIAHYRENFVLQIYDPSAKAVVLRLTSRSR